MSFRQGGNTHDHWVTIVEENEALLRELPKGAVKNISAFRDYLTGGARRDDTLMPSVFQLSDQALDDLHVFLTDKAQFDMEVTYFYDFVRAFRRRNSQVE